MIKNKKVRKRKKFKNFIHQLYYLNTYFGGHLEKMSAVQNYPVMRPFLPHPHILYIYS